MIDAFITHKPAGKERDYFFGLTQLALYANGFCAKIVEKPLLERYFECERLATSDVYILCDDDIIPSTSTTLKELVDLLVRHPDYSQLGLGWRKDMQVESDSTWIRSKENSIWEMDHVGGCMAIRKGTIKDLGYKTEFESGYGDDRVMGKVARELGYKVGIVPGLFFYHLGGGHSTFNEASKL